MSGLESTTTASTKGHICGFDGSTGNALFAYSRHQGHLEFFNCNHAFESYGWGEEASVFAKRPEYPYREYLAKV